MSSPEVLQMFVDDQEILLQMSDAEIEWLKERVAELEKEIERLQMQYGFERDARRAVEFELENELGQAEDERSDR